VCYVQDGVIPAGLVIDYSTPGMKELDALAADIDSLKRYVRHSLPVGLLGVNLIETISLSVHPSIRTSTKSSV